MLPGHPVKCGAACDGGRAPVRTPVGLGAAGELSRGSKNQPSIPGKRSLSCWAPPQPHPSRARLGAERQRSSQQRRAPTPTRPALAPPRQTGCTLHRLHPSRAAGNMLLEGRLPACLPGWGGAGRLVQLVSLRGNPAGMGPCQAAARCGMGASAPSRLPPLRAPMSLRVLRTARWWLQCGSAGVFVVVEPPPTTPTRARPRWHGAQPRSRALAKAKALPRCCSSRKNVFTPERRGQAGRARPGERQTIRRPRQEQARPAPPTAATRR